VLRLPDGHEIKAMRGHLMLASPVIRDAL
jgi:hypothetical protein